MPYNPMPKVFIDTSVIFSSLLSNSGASAKIFKSARSLDIFISQYVIDEVHDVLKQKAPHLLDSFEQMLRVKDFAITPAPRKRLVLKARKIISDPKDAPILAAAISAKVDYLVTLDKKDFINDAKVAERSGLTIVTPGQFVKLLKSNSL